MFEASRYVNSELVYKFCSRSSENDVKEDGALKILFTSEILCRKFDSLFHIGQQNKMF